MKKTNLIKLITILLIGVMVAMFSTTVFAADDDGIDLTESLSNGNKNNNSGNTNANANANNNISNSNVNNNNANSNANNNNANKANNNVNVNNSNTNKDSVYNNNKLPKTGIGDSVPVAMLVVVFGISAVYAYKKVKDYRNI